MVATPYSSRERAHKRRAGGGIEVMILIGVALTSRAAPSTNRAMTDDVRDSLIPYDEIVQDALRAVVGRVLSQVEREGLPGDHHFYITFKTRAPGVAIPTVLTERFPDEMTIVLQNRYWDLAVHDDRFEVGLSFNQVPSHLSVPFAAISGFVDPAVDFGLQFQVADTEGAPEPHDAAENDEPDKGGTDGDASNVVTVDFGRKR